MVADRTERGVMTRRLHTLASKFEPDLRTRVDRLVLAAKEAIFQLAEVDLVRFEAGAEEGSHTLAVWEEVAPVMGATVASVNNLVAVAEETFPPPPESDAADNLDEAFGPAKKKDDDDLPEAVIFDSEEEDLARMLATVTTGLKRDVARLGERLKQPGVVADTWNLISDLLEFRGRLRAGIGELIYEVASRVEEVERFDVVPGYADDLQQALLLRHAATNLAFLFRGHAKRIASAPDDRVAVVLGEGLRDVHAFSRTRAMQGLRTADKKIFIEARAQLLHLLREKPFKVREARQGAENLARFFDSLSVISRRENLRVHDRAQLAAAGRALEAAHSQAGNPAQVRVELGSAVRAVTALYGRDAQLDSYVRAQRHFPVEWLAEPEMTPEIERLSALLAAVPHP
jgi:hypothetical protein